MPVIDHWWQTETGWPISANCVGLGHVAGEAGVCGVPVPGYDVRVLTDEGAEARAGETGNVVIKLPPGAGVLPTLWNNNAAYSSSYLSAYPGHYLTPTPGTWTRTAISGS